MLDGLRPTEILILLLVVLLLFGAKRLPDLAKGIGKSVRILRDEVKDRDDDRPAGTTGDDAPPAAQATPAAQPTPRSNPTPPADDAEHQQV